MKFIHDTWILFQRNLRGTLRNPVWVIIGLFQPLCYLLLFGPLLEPLSKVPGFPPGGAWTVFAPAILVMMGIFGTFYAGFGLLMEVQTGVIERFRVTPVSRLALLMGMVLRDVLILLVQAILLTLVALLLGAHIQLVGLLLTLVLLVLLAACLASCSYALALTLRDVNALSSSLNFFSLPVVLLSGIWLPLTLGPPLLRTIADFDPFSYVVDAARHLFIGSLGDISVLRAFGIMAVLAALALFWAARSFRKATA